MAGNKITAQIAQSAAIADDDLFVIVDVSDTSQGAGGTTKKITIGDLFIRRFLGTQFDKTSDTALQAISDLTVPLAAGGKYAIRAALQVSAGASGGHKYLLAGGSGLTATSINYYVQAQTGTSAPTIGKRITALTTPAGVTSALEGLTFITGGIVVNTAGNLRVQFAQNASDSTTSSVLIGSWIEAVRIG